MLKSFCLIPLLCLTTLAKPFWFIIADVICRGKGQKIEVTFSVRKETQLPGSGIPDTIKDTGVALVRVPKTNVYYLTKDESEPVRFDGKLFNYEGCYVLCTE